MDDYIDLYSDQKKSKLSTSEYKSRLKKIQDKYNGGIAHLKKGDEQATSL